MRAADLCGRDGGQGDGSAQGQTATTQHRGEWRPGAGVVAEVQTNGTSSSALGQMAAAQYKGGRGCPCKRDDDRGSTGRWHDDNLVRGRHRQPNARRRREREREGCGWKR